MLRWPLGGDGEKLPEEFPFPLDIENGCEALPELGATGCIGVLFELVWPNWNEPTGSFACPPEVTGGLNSLLPPEPAWGCAGVEPSASPRACGLDFVPLAF